MNSCNVTKHFLKLFIIPAIVIINACTSIQLVSDYDENIDKGTAALHKKIDSYFVSFSSMSPDEKKYKNQQKFYESLVVDLNALKVRASAIYKNELTQDQLSLVEENIAYLLLLHKGCITGQLTASQKENVTDNGIDTSVDCKQSHGASADSRGRGDKVINELLVPPIQTLFDQHLGALMALELAKKRGED